MLSVSSLYVVLSEELDVWECANDVLTYQLPQLVVLKELVPGALWSCEDHMRSCEIM